MFLKSCLSAYAINYRRDFYWLSLSLSLWDIYHGTVSFSVLLLLLKSTSIVKDYKGIIIIYFDVMLLILLYLVNVSKDSTFSSFAGLNF